MSLIGGGDYTMDHAISWSSISHISDRYMGEALPAQCQVDSKQAG